MSLFRNVYYERDLERDAKNDRKIAALKVQRAHILTRLLDQQSVSTSVPLVRGRVKCAMRSTYVRCEVVRAA